MAAIAPPGDGGTPAQVLVVEDHGLIAESIHRALDQEDDLHVIGRVSRVVDAVGITRELHPDLIVMDFVLPDGTGAEATAEIHVTQPAIQSVILTGHPSPDRLLEALDAGCGGFVGKDQPFAELLTTLRAARTGELRVPPPLVSEAARYLAGRRNVPRLSKRELEVIRRLAAGDTTEGIAASLFLSVHTVRNHVRNLLAKLGARTRLEAVATARHRGLLSDDPVVWHASGVARARSTTEPRVRRP